MEEIFSLVNCFKGFKEGLWMLDTLVLFWGGDPELIYKLFTKLA